jgi:hypothetical protein
LYNQLMEDIELLDGVMPELDIEKVRHPCLHSLCVEGQSRPVFSCVNGIKVSKWFGRAWASQMG